MSVWWMQWIAQASAALVALLGMGAQAERLSSTPWEDLVAAPFESMEPTRQMHVQFHSLVEEWEPYRTPFSRRTHLAVRAWSEAQLPWNTEDFHAPAVLLYVPRDTPAARLFLAAHTHDRIVLIGQLRAWLLDRPWFEVRSARRCRVGIGKGSVLHAIKGLELMEQGVLGHAQDQLRRALAAPLPHHASRALEELLILCRQRAQGSQQ